jgi:hypothetical protein
LKKPNTLLFLCIIVAAELASAQTNGPVPSIQQIVIRIAQARAANHARFR